MKYEETPIGEVTTRAKNDMALIQQDVEQKRWSSVIEGVKYQVSAFTELLADLETLQKRGVLRG